MKVLIVESTDDLAQLWRRHLERQGAEVAIAASGDQAIEMISDTPFDVIHP